MDYSYIILAAVAGLVIGMVFAFARRGRGSSPRRTGEGGGYAGAPLYGGGDGREGDRGAAGARAAPRVAADSEAMEEAATAEAEAVAVGPEAAPAATD